MSDDSDRVLLSDDQIETALADLPGWASTEGSLTYTAVCDTPERALELVLEIGRAANSLDHHPDLLWSYDEVTLDLYSHDVDGVTERDLRLARAVCGLAGEFEASPLVD